LVYLSWLVKKKFLLFVTFAVIFTRDAVVVFSVEGKSVSVVVAGLVVVVEIIKDVTFVAVVEGVCSFPVVVTFGLFCNTAVVVGSHVRWIDESEIYRKLYLFNIYKNCQKI
jgi:hypothetical protein